MLVGKALTYEDVISTRKQAWLKYEDYKAIDNWGDINIKYKVKCIIYILENDFGRVVHLERTKSHENHKETDYAFRICGYLLTWRRSSDKYDELYRKDLLLGLRKLNLAGITTAKEGVTGGYMLNKPKGSSLYDIMVL